MTERNRQWRPMVQRARVEGFVILDHFARFGEALADLGEWAAGGKLVREVDLQRGFENVPETLVRLYTGENFGKQLLEL